MDTHRTIEISRRIYARLLGLYPAGHRAAYGADMLQLFTDQCRESAQGGRRAAVLALWLRTLADLGASALREHLTAPRSWQGFLEAVPGAPLPWGGAALVLLPGLVFFIAQVAQLTGRDWFFLLSYRAGYVMILPVLAVWIWKRRFPIWGLMPLGLFFRTGLEFAFRMTFRYMEKSNPFNAWWLDLVRADATAVNVRLAACALMILTILGLLWLVRRRVGISRAAWVGLGAYLAVSALLAYRNLENLFTWLRNLPKDEAAQQIALGIFNPWADGFDSVYYVMFDHLGLLIVVLLGALLARRHGRLTALLPLGYLLPSVIFGRVSDTWPGAGDPNFAFMLTVSAAALAYRFLVALAGPLWLVRSASGELQKRASAVSLLTLVGIQVAFNLAMLLARGAGVMGTGYAFALIAQQVVVAGAMFVAVMLYRGRAEVAERTLPESQAGLY